METSLTFQHFILALNEFHVMLPLVLRTEFVLLVHFSDFGMCTRTNKGENKINIVKGKGREVWQHLFAILFLMAETKNSSRLERIIVWLVITALYNWVI